MATFHNLSFWAEIPTIWENIHPEPTFLGLFSIAFQIFIIEDGNQLYFHQGPYGHLSQPFLFGQKSPQYGEIFIQSLDFRGFSQ